MTDNTVNVPLLTGTHPTMIFLGFDGDANDFRALVSDARELDGEARLSWNHDRTRPNLIYRLELDGQPVSLLVEGPAIREARPFVPDVEDALADA